MTEKGGESARLRFHVYFPIEEKKNADEYSKYKEKIYSSFSYFDGNELDAARFIYGTKNLYVEIYDGELKIIDFFN